MHLNTPYYVGGVQMHSQFFTVFGGGLLQFYQSFAPTLQPVKTCLGLVVIDIFSHDPLTYRNV